MCNTLATCTYILFSLSHILGIWAKFDSFFIFFKKFFKVKKSEYLRQKSIYWKNIKSGI